MLYCKYRKGHYNCRLAIIAHSIDDLKNKMCQLDKTGFMQGNVKNVYYGKHTLAESYSSTNEKGRLTIEQKNALDKNALEAAGTLSGRGNWDESILPEISRLYIEGTDIKWEEVYKGRNRKRVSIPCYGFEKKRCWIEVPYTDDAKGLYYGTRWISRELADERIIEPKDECILVLTGNKGPGQDILKAIRDRGLEVIEAEPGDRFIKENNDKYVIRPVWEDYNKLFEEIKERKVSRILHLLTLSNEGSVSDLKQLKDSQVSGAYSLFHSVKAIAENRLRGKIEFILVSRYVNSVTSEDDKVYPENAVLFGLGKVIPQENPHLSCRCIDIDHLTDQKCIVDELASEYQYYQVAYRKGKRYVEEFYRNDLSDYREEKFKLKKDGVYIITGGTSGIGLEIGKYLAVSAGMKINMALIGRSKIPQRSEWQNILEEQPDSDLSKRIKSVIQLEDKGAGVEYFSADVSNIEEMRSVIDSLRQKHRQINGIVHSAGVAGDGFIIRKDEKTFKEVLRPKVEGTWILDKLTGKEDLDFFIMFSSLASILGGEGQGDYTAANSYLDSFSSYRRVNGKKALTVNWPMWKETGMGVTHRVNGEKAIFKPLTTVEGLSCFEDVIKRDIPRVIIGELNCNNILLGEKGNLPLLISDEIKSCLHIKDRVPGSDMAGTEKNKPLKEAKLQGRSDKDYNEVEKFVAKVWREVLGFEEFNINDNFFDIGGDSILLTWVFSHMEEKYPGKLTLADLFAYSTIHKISQFITSEEEKKGAKQQAQQNQDDKAIKDEISRLVDEIKLGKATIDSGLERINSIKKNKN